MFRSDDETRRFWAHSWGRCYACWCDCSLNHQVNSNHSIGYVGWIGHFPPRGMVLTTCFLSVWRNERKYKYILMLHLKNMSIPKAKIWRPPMSHCALERIASVSSILAYNIYTKMKGTWWSWLWISKALSLACYKAISPLYCGNRWNQSIYKIHRNICR